MSDCEIRKQERADCSVDGYTQVATNLGMPELGSEAERHARIRQSAFNWDADLAVIKKTRGEGDRKGYVFCLYRKD
jgi:hypothetical protein